MILNTSGKTAPDSSATGPTLDGLLAHWAQERPDRLALVDAPHRAALAGGEPRQLTFAALERDVGHLASQLVGLGLPTDSVVAVQMGQVSEAVIALLAIARAGMIAAPVPLGWGRRETVAHLQRLSAKAILSMSRNGPVDSADIMRHAAAQVFSVRYVCSFGQPILDGVMPLDAVLDQSVAPVPYVLARAAAAEDHIVIVTADATPAGHIAIARSHRQLFAAAAPARDALALDSGACLAAPLALDSLAGLATQLVPWLDSGCRLDLVPPFAVAPFHDAVRAGAFTHCVLPAQAAGLIAPITADGVGNLRTALLLARSAEDLALANSGDVSAVTMPVVFAAGEAGLIPTQPQTEPCLLDAAHARVSAEGALLVSGDGVPTHAFPPAAGNDAPFWAVGPDGSVDTGYRAERLADGIRVAAPPAGIVRIGGRRFAEADIRAAYEEAGGEIQPVIRADALLGQRIAGVSGNGRGIAGLAGRLDESGLSPLAIPGATRYGGQIPFEETANAPELDIERIDSREHVLRQLLVE